VGAYYCSAGGGVFVADGVLEPLLLFVLGFCGGGEGLAEDFVRLFFALHRDAADDLLLHRLGHSLFELVEQDFVAGEDDPTEVLGPDEFGQLFEDGPAVIVNLLIASAFVSLLGPAAFADVVFDVAAELSGLCEAAEGCQIDGGAGVVGIDDGIRLVVVEQSCGREEEGGIIQIGGRFDSYGQLHQGDLLCEPRDHSYPTKGLGEIDLANRFLPKVQATFAMLGLVGGQARSLD